MRTVMSNRWICLRGIEVVTITFSSLNITIYDGKILAEVQKATVLRNPLLQTAHLADTMEDIAHDNTKIEIGPTDNGENITNTEDHKATYTWTCNCGNITTSNFCSECGAQRPLRWCK